MLHSMMLCSVCAERRVQHHDTVHSCGGIHNNARTYGLDDLATQQGSARFSKPNIGSHCSSSDPSQLSSGANFLLSSSVARYFLYAYDMTIKGLVYLLHIACPLVEITFTSFDSYSFKSVTYFTSAGTLLFHINILV